MSEGTLRGQSASRDPHRWLILPDVPTNDRHTHRTDMTASRRELVRDLTVLGNKPSARSRQTQRGWQHLYSRQLLVSDIAVVCGSVMLAQHARFGELQNTSGYSDLTMTLLTLLFATLWLSALARFQTRSRRVVGAGIDEYWRIANASFWTFGIIAMGTYLAKVDLARGYFSIALPVGTLGLLTSRSLWRKHIGRQRVLGRCQTRVLAIGDPEAVSHLADELARRPEDGCRVVGFCIPGYRPFGGGTMSVDGRHVPILGDQTYALAAIASCGADTVAVTRTAHFGVREIRELMWQLETLDVDLVVSPGVFDVGEARLALRLTAGLPLLHIEKPQYEGAQRFQKYAFDLCFSVAALIAASPLLVAAAVAVKLTSSGPVFYKSERIGIGGKPFNMLKIRTMTDGADAHVDVLSSLNESSGGVLFKMRRDPRVTPVGVILRRFSIDELPQFINVVKREMSVVGPRPPLPQEVKKYDVDVKRRLLVKPGVTGLWQVSGRSDLSWDDSVRLDLSYVDNWSMAGDLVIIAKTLKAVLTSRGAY